MNGLRPIRLVTALILALLLITAYVKMRPRVFEMLAKGTDWVLVACGFANREDLMARDDDRWRRLYYAIRMFKSTPPRQLIPEDALADRKYPGMGFGIVHTFSRAPVSRVIGGWLFSIPCVYFTDAQECQNDVPNIARISVDQDSFSPIRATTIEEFLKANSSKVLRITIMGREQRQANWWVTDPQKLLKMPDTATGYEKYALTKEVAGNEANYYQLYIPLADVSKKNQLWCTDPRWALEKNILDHCLIRFMFNEDIIVEIKSPATLKDHWPQLIKSARDLVYSFQVHR